MSFSTLLNQDAGINRHTYEANSFSAGGSESHETTTLVRCSIQPISGRESFQYAKLTSRVSHIGYFDPAADVKVDDQVVSNSRTYNVVAVMDAAGRGHHIEVLLDYVDER